MSQQHDIDAVINGVRAMLPQVDVTQLQVSHPGADDDGLWWFRLSGGSRIQLESSTYNCPFLVEHDDMTSTSEALTAHSVPEAVSLVVSYLHSISSAT